MFKLPLRFYACGDGGCSTSCMNGVGPCSSCKDICSSGCQTCSTHCGDVCVETCRGGCKTTCSGTCEGCTGCSGCGGCGTGCSSCTGSCTDACNNGCTNQNVTNIYNRIALNTVLMANDIIDLRDLVANEVTRRSKTPTDVTVAANSTALAATINAIISNITATGKTANTQAQPGRIENNATVELIAIAKALYETNLKA